jgi:hypothetical protein
MGNASETDVPATVAVVATSWSIAGQPPGARPGAVTSGSIRASGGATQPISAICSSKSVAR